MLSSRIPITAAGAEKLKAELEYLKKTARPAVVQAIAEAREKAYKNVEKIHFDGM